MVLSWGHVLVVLAEDKAVVIFGDQASWIAIQGRIRPYKWQSDLIWLTRRQSIRIKLVKVLAADTKARRIWIRHQLSQAHLPAATITKTNA
jgi:hypothetical protein